MIDTLPQILKKEAWDKLIETASLIVESKLDIVEGSRLILKYAHQSNILEDQIFLPLRGFVDQSEHLLIGKARKQANTEYLDKLDREKKEFVKEFKIGIMQDCREIINKYSR